MNYAIRAPSCEKFNCTPSLVTIIIIVITEQNILQNVTVCFYLCVLNKSWRINYFYKMKNGSINSTRDPKKVQILKVKSKLKKNIGFVLFAAIILALFGLLIYLLSYDKIEVCTTSSCVRMSMELTKHIDVKVDPCEDFYRFSCGNFLQNTNLDNRGSRSVDDIMADEIQFQIRSMLEQPIQPEDFGAFNLAKKFYRACMNETAIEAEGLEKIKQIFEQIGGWPTLKGNNWRESQFDWKEAVHKLRRLGVRFDFFFRVTVDRDKEDDSRYILGIHGMSYTPSQISTETRRMYLDYMVDVAVRFGAKREAAVRDSIAVVNLLLKLAKVSEESAAADKNELHEVLNLSELLYKYPNISWEWYINGLSDSTAINYNDVIEVRDPHYLNGVYKLLGVTPNRSLANFIVWHTLQYLINYLPADILDLAYGYLEKINGKIVRKPRWITCVKATEERMNPVISAGYIQHFFDDQTRSKVGELIRNIKIQFKYNIQMLDWLDEETKGKITEGLVSSVEDIASDYDLMEIMVESHIYDHVQVNESRLLESALNLDLVALNMEFGKLRERVRENWLKNSSFVTGLTIHYSPKENALRFPIGLLRGIYYQSDRPNYMNYGVFGSVTAHEISHIVIEAEYRNLPGKLRSWWSPNSLVQYDEKLQCLSNQYEKFVVLELGKHLNPVKTRDEDMADLAGMKVSYDTYINWVQENGAEPQLPGLNYSPNQLFWISSAIHHCSKDSPQSLERNIANYQWSPRQFRVNGPLQNLKEFAYDFRCPTGSKMNPVEKCIVW